MAQMETRIGGLEVRLSGAVGAGRDTELAVVLCHGYGATGGDLVPLGGEMARRYPSLSQRALFVFPAAPLRLSAVNPLFGDARAWWHIEVGRYEQAMRSGRLDPLLEEVPEGLPSARRKIRALLSEVQRITDLPMSQIILGGFSQGSMLALDVTLNLDEAPAALVIMSSALIARTEWTRRASIRRGLTVLQSHGRRDELLPFAVAERLRDMLAEAGLEVRFEAFDDGHTIPMSVVQSLATLARDCLPG